MENTWQSDLKTQEMALSGISQLPITMPPDPLEPCAFGKMVTIFFFFLNWHLQTMVTIMCSENINHFRYNYWTIFKARLVFDSINKSTSDINLLLT